MKLFLAAKGLVIHNGKALLLRESSEYEEGTAEGKWDVPGGRIDAGELLRDGLVREVKEESGLGVEPLELLGIFDQFHEIKGEQCHIVRTYFACATESDAVQLSQDHDTFEWIGPKEVSRKTTVPDIDIICETYIKRFT